MEDSNKLPLKRVELSLTKFNEVAIPHHLDLLRQHKANILKSCAAGEYVRARGEQAAAARAAARLRALLAEMDALRRSVREQDLPAFDARTQNARALMLRAIVDYLESGPEPSARRESGSDEQNERAEAPQLQAEVPQLQVDERALRLAEREEALRGWLALQAEVRALHDAWQHVQAAALHQRELSARAATDVDAAAEHVAAARAHLAAGERLRGGAWLAAGAAAGALAGGPVGLAVGAKAGALAALAGSLLGAAAARLLPRRAPPDKRE